MKLTFIIITLFLFNNSYSQYGFEYIKPEIAKKNKVKKSIEFDFDDSTNYFKIFPNGNYNVFNKNGEIIESNFYMKTSNKEGTDIKSFQTIKLFIYDLNGGKTTLWIDENDGYKNIFLALYNYRDTIKNLEITKYLESGSETKKEILKPKFKDSIIHNKFTEIIEFEADNKKDTFSITTKYFSNNLTDSIIKFFPKTKTELLERFKYIDQKISTYSKTFIINGIINNTVKIKYNQFELPVETWNINYYNNKIKNEYHTGIKYEYYEKRNGELFNYYQSK